MRRSPRALRQTQSLLVTMTVVLGANPASSQCPPGNITVIDMVPHDRSSESFEDSEPSLAVDYANPFHLVGTAFTPDPMNPLNPNKLAPIYYSTDGGATWYINPILPIVTYSLGGTNDVSVCFGGTSGNLYIAMLPAGGSNLMKVLVTTNFTTTLPANNPLTELFEWPKSDQPHVTAMTAWGPVKTGKDLVYVTFKDFVASQGKTSTLRHSETTPLTPSDAFKTLTLEEGLNCNQDGPSVVSAPHLSGHVYAAFIRWLQGCPGTSSSSSARLSDLVVLRDDEWGVGVNAFTGLLNGTSRGKTAVAGFIDLDDSLSRQRVKSSMSIASSPVHDDWVYLAWVDAPTSSSSSYKLHLKRSTDSGETWGLEIAPIPLAINPALAVNNHGVVGLVYQKLVGWNPSVPNSGSWETHFMTRNPDLTSRRDDILATLPNNAPQINGPGPLGDYLQLAAVGKNFYGVFSSMNNPQCQYFPQGVTFLRNVNWATHSLFDLVGAPVANSIDPFFFKVRGILLEEDFYVRDWTESPASGDLGLEPSSHRNFYSTSDVWNRRSVQPGSFPADQPENQDAGTGAGSDGDNWAFARIRRNAASASGSQTVTVHFLVSKFGTGSNFVDASSGDPDVTFPAPDPTVLFTASNQGPSITPAYPWHLNTSASSHICMAVEISTPDDPIVAPSLRGNAPGWQKGADLRVMYDNNKAQRNMGSVSMFTLGPELDKWPSSSGGIYYAIIHNAATFTRNVELRYEFPPQVLQVLPRSSVEVVGGRKNRLQESGKSIVLKGMKPGENRWIAFNTGKPNLQKDSVKSPGREPVTELPVYFYDMVGELPANGFGISVRSVPPATLYSENVRFHKSTFARPLLGSFPAAREVMDETVPEAEYLRFLGSFLEDWDRYGRGVLDSVKLGDPFHLLDAGKDLSKALNSGDAAMAATSHGAFLNRLDSFVTMVDLSGGDRADILQNVRWQLEIFEASDHLKGLVCRNSIVDASRAFIEDYSNRAINESNYPDHIRSVLPCLREIAQNARKHRRDLLEACDRMQRYQEDPRALQRAHRDYLLDVDPR